MAQGIARSSGSIYILAAEPGRNGRRQHNKKAANASLNVNTEVSLTNEMAAEAIQQKYLFLAENQ